MKNKKEIQQKKVNSVQDNVYSGDSVDHLREQEEANLLLVAEEIAQQNENL